MKPTLDILQRWMQSVISHPGGIAAGVKELESREPFGLSPVSLEQIIEPSNHQTATQRLAIYANAYYQRLIECLETEFPIFRQTVGDKSFVEFAIEYLQRYPPRSYNLGRLSANFDQFLDETKPASSSNENGNSAWAEFLVDLARLEQTLNEVFDGPGNEGVPGIAAAEIGSIDRHDWSNAKLRFAPCVRLMTFRFAVNRYYTEAKRGEHRVQPYLDRKDSWLAISRRDFIVRRNELTHPQFLLLSSLLEGASVGEAILVAAGTSQSTPDVFSKELKSWFQEWSRLSIFQAVLIR
jgi:hypothetical protein